MRSSAARRKSVNYSSLNFLVMTQWAALFRGIMYLPSIAPSWFLGYSPAASPGLILALCFGLFVGPGQTARAAEWKASGKPDLQLTFDIPAQSLPKALDAFSAATGIEVLVDARNAEGRLSKGVGGVMSAREALRILLTGIPLVAEEFTPETVTLMRATRGQNIQTGLATASYGPPYFAVVQRAVLHQLCRIQDTVPGRYRLALRLQIGSDGSVLRWKLLDSTGDTGRDRAVATALSGLNIGEPPPADLPQPLAIVVRPRASHVPVDCSVAAKTPGAFNSWQGR